MHPKSWTKNLRFEMFFLRFSKEDKINIYHMYQKGYGYSEIKEYYPIGEGNFYYLIRTLNRYVVRPHHKWTSQEKRKPLIEY